MSYRVLGSNFTSAMNLLCGFRLATILPGTDSGYKTRCVTAPGEALHGTEWMHLALWTASDADLEYMLLFVPDTAGIR